MKRHFGILVVFGLLFGAFGCTGAEDVEGRVVVCLERVDTASWQAFPLAGGNPPSAAARSTVWGKQSFLVADKFVGSVGVGGAVRFAFFKREFKKPADRERFVDEMKKGKASAVGFLSLTLDAPVVERGLFMTVTQRLAYKLIGANGRVWTAGTVSEKATGRPQTRDALLVDAVDGAVAALARQLSLKMQP